MGGGRGEKGGQGPWPLTWEAQRPPLLPQGPCCAGVGGPSPWHEAAFPEDQTQLLGGEGGSRGQPTQLDTQPRGPWHVTNSSPQLPHGRHVPKTVPGMQCLQGRWDSHSPQVPKAASAELRRASLSEGVGCEPLSGPERVNPPVMVPIQPELSRSPFLPLL